MGRPSLCAILLAIGLGVSQPAVAQPAPCERPVGRALRDVFWRHAASPHPLVGQVLKGDAAINITPAACAPSPLQQLAIELWQVIRSDGIVLLGEVHDNAEHHRVRGDILWPRIGQWLATNNLRPAAVFEHLRTSQQVGLDRFYEKARRSRRLLGASDLLREVDWETSGWPAGEIFKPVFAGALWAKLPIHPGNGVRERTRAIVRGEAGDLSAQEAARLELARAMPDPLLQTLATELEGSHCGMLPASAVPAMSLVQRYTDAHLAGAVVDAADGQGGAFLLAGNGHVRTDRGVPWYLRRLVPQRRVAAVLLLEVTEGETDAQRYLPRTPEGGVAADYVLFTPRQERTDPCEAMRKGKR